MSLLNFALCEEKWKPGLYLQPADNTFAQHLYQ